MVAPSSNNPSGEMQVAPPAQGFGATLPGGAPTTRHFLRTFGFQLLIGLLSIALAFL
jgi:hypothetical protein